MATRVGSGSNQYKPYSILVGMTPMYHTLMLRTYTESIKETITIHTIHEQRWC